NSTRLPEGVPIRLREEPDDLLACPGPAEAIAEVLDDEQPRDYLLRAQEVSGPVRRGDHREKNVDQPSAHGVELDPVTRPSDGAEHAAHGRTWQVRATGRRCAPAVVPTVGLRRGRRCGRFTAFPPSL